MQGSGKDAQHEIHCLISYQDENKPRAVEAIQLPELCGFEQSEAKEQNPVSHCVQPKGVSDT